MGSATRLQIRPPRADEHDRLRRIAAAAKGHWGYDADRVQAWADTMSFDSPATATRELYVADDKGRAAAWAALVHPRDNVTLLDDLWVDPPWIGRGVGSLLFRHALERAAALGADVMEWVAEPNALGFYEKLGGRHLRTEISEWGRELSVMGVELARRRL